MAKFELKTDRLLLRQWKESDFPVFAQLNADPQVRQYFPDLQSCEQSDADARTCQSLIEQRGWGFWALEKRKTNEFIGFVGLHEPVDLPFCPCVEIGWRLQKHHWGNAYATEAAKETLRFAFETLNLSEVVSFTVVDNAPSRKVMQRVGMRNTQRNFAHPSLPIDHPLSEHVLYAITQREWLNQTMEL